jgi:hypothetical protein
MIDDKEPFWTKVIRIQHDQNISWREARRVAEAEEFMEAKKERKRRERELLELAHELQQVTTKSS